MTSSASDPSRTPGWRAIPGGVWALGMVSMFMDISSELIHSLLPVFLVGVLHASTVEVGLIEGVAEATASISKIFSGALSDWWGRRKELALLGYGLAALTKPIFAWAPSVSWIFFARFADRVGKGIRGAPRDALVGELAPSGMRGACYGLRQALDTVGAFLGPLLAIILMVVTGNHFQTVFWVATLPAVCCVLILMWGVHEPETAMLSARAGAGHATDPAPAPTAIWHGLDRGFWILVTVSAVVTFARFSEAFLVLRAQVGGMSVALVPTVLVTMNAVYAVTAYPVGHLADRLSRPAMLAASLVPLMAADAVLAWAPALWVVMLGVALWGLHMGMSQGLLSAMVADAVPVARRGTGFGVFYLVTGLALLVASVMAGWLWGRYGAPATFIASGALSGIALVATRFLRTDTRSDG